MNAKIGMSVVVPAPDAAVAAEDSSSLSEPLMTSVEDVGKPLRTARAHAPKRAVMFDVESTPTLRRPLRKASAREVDLAIIDLTVERADEVGYGREYDRLADDRHVGRLEPA